MPALSDFLTMQRNRRSGGRGFFDRQVEEASMVDDLGSQRWQSSNAIPRRPPSIQSFRARGIQIGRQIFRHERLTRFEDNAVVLLPGQYGDASYTTCVDTTPKVWHLWQVPDFSVGRT